MKKTLWISPTGDKDFLAHHGDRRFHVVPTDSDEPRCDLTGQSLTVRERFERECG